jgi:Icc-related predicted phosphoesterase
MRVPAIYDIHGNLPVLEAVLQDAASHAVDLIVIGGNVVPGPMPRASLVQLRAIDTPVRFIKGNGEREVLAARRGETLTTVPPREADMLDVFSRCAAAAPGSR